jgi:Outer membrane protein beta-barrel domain
MPKGPRLLLRFCAQLLLPALSIASFAPVAHAQATPAASKTLDFSVFGAYNHSDPDYGPYGNNGGTFGFNATRYFHFPVSPSLEFRINYSDGKTVRENSYLGGLRGQMTVFHRFHPYAMGLIGTGDIHFNFHNFELGDNSIVYSVGGGTDFDIYRNLQGKFDWQYQFWSTGNNASLTPTITSIGIAYRIPFAPHNKQGTIP